jgi:hypothetical protein
MTSTCFSRIARLSLLLCATLLQSQAVTALHGPFSGFDGKLDVQMKKPTMHQTPFGFKPNPCEEVHSIMSAQICKSHLKDRASMALRVRGGSQAAFASASMMAANPEMAKQFLGSNLISQSRKIGSIFSACLLAPRTAERWSQSRRLRSHRAGASFLFPWLHALSQSVPPLCPFCFPAQNSPWC